MLATSKNELAPSLLYKEVSALNTVFTSLQGTTSLDKWKYFSTNNLLLQNCENWLNNLLPFLCQMLG